MEEKSELDNINADIKNEFISDNKSKPIKNTAQEQVKNISSTENEKSTSLNTAQEQVKNIQNNLIDNNNSKNKIANAKEEIDKKKELNKVNEVKVKNKPIKELPIEKKPFQEFVNDHLIPEIIIQFEEKGKKVNQINLKKTSRPIAEDICWVIYCEVSETCNFWLSFEKEDITSLKSFSLCKKYEKPSILESFLIDEKKITLKLIISRILQRLNGQKLIGAN